MVTVNINHNINGLVALLNDKLRKQIPFATSKSLNRVAEIAKKEVYLAMSRNFDRPTPYTMRSLYVRRSDYRRNVMYAEVLVKDKELSKNPYPLSETLHHQFTGGTRIRKRLEKILNIKGFITTSEFLVPASGAELDAYGNIKKSQVQKILSQLQAQTDKAANSSDSKRSKSKRIKAGEFFWSYGNAKGHNGSLSRGVWLRKNDGKFLKPVLIVTRTPKYKRLIYMDQIVERVVNKSFDGIFKQELEAAMRSAK